MLRFDEKRHIYTYDGVTVPNVTSVIDYVFDKFSSVPSDILERARALGTAVHLATALYDLNDLDIDALDIALIPYLEGWIRFRNETGLTIEAVETRIYHPRHHYAGTVDRIVELFGERAIIDIKSGALMPESGLQTAAYAEAVNYRNSNKASSRYVVQLNGKGGYMLNPMKGREDFSVFLSCLNIYQWRKKHD